MSDVAAHAARLEPHLTVIKPMRPGPLPVVVQMHGCGGLTPNQQRRYAEAAAAADDGLDCRTLFHPEATHSFDEDDYKDPRTRYRPDLTEQTVAFYVEALTAMAGAAALRKAV